MYSCNYQKTVVPQCGFHFEELAKLFSQSELHRIGLQSGGSKSTILRKMGQTLIILLFVLDFKCIVFLFSGWTKQH